MNRKEHVLNAALLSIGLGYVVHPDGGPETLRFVGAVTLPVVLGALFPDVDAVLDRHRKTLHNLPVLAAFYAFPRLFANLHFVWVGVLTHYVLDVVGSRRGVALFYPVVDTEYRLPLGVTVASKHASLVTVLVTGVELVVAAALIWNVPALVLGAVRRAVGV